MLSENEIQNLLTKYNARNGCFDKLNSFCEITWHGKFVVNSTSKWKFSKQEYHFVNEHLQQQKLPGTELSPESVKKAHRLQLKFKQTEVIPS